jgi:hypothetical protein
MVESRTPRWELPQWGDPDTDAPDMADFNEGFLKIDAAPIDLQGTLATRPGPGVAGRYHWATDAGLLARDDGTAWQPVGAAPGNSAPVVSSSTASAAGTALPYAREDHRHGFTSGTPTVSAPADAAAQGTAAALARSDHRHGREGFGTPAASAPGDVTAAGSAATLARSDHVHGREAAIVVPQPATALPTSSGSTGGIVGTSALYAREDHRHGTAYGSTIPALAPGDASAAGSASGIARSDHAHGLPAWGSVATAHSMPGDTRSNGAAAAFARADHRHGREDTNRSVTPIAQDTRAGTDLPATYPEGISYTSETGQGPGGWPAAGGQLLTVREGGLGLTHQHFVSHAGSPTGRVYSRVGGGTAWGSWWNLTPDPNAALMAATPSTSLLIDYPPDGDSRPGVFYATAVTADGYPVQGTLVTFKRSDNYGYQELAERVASGTPRFYRRAAYSGGGWSAWAQIS